MTFSEFLKMNPYHGMKVSFEWDGVKEIGVLVRSDNYLIHPEHRWRIATSIYQIPIFEMSEFDQRITNLKPMTNNTHPLADLKAGDYLKNEYAIYQRVLSDVQHPELGELATVLVSIPHYDKNHDDSKRVLEWKTLFQLSKDGCKKETPRTIDDVLATLSEKDRKIVEEEIK